MELFLPRGTKVQINSLGSNQNKAIWGEDALEWKPERWIGKSPDEVARIKLPGVYSSMYVYNRHICAEC